LTEALPSSRPAFTRIATTAPPRATPFPYRPRPRPKTCEGCAGREAARVAADPRCIVCILIMVVMLRGAHTGTRPHRQTEPSRAAVWRLAGCATEGLRTPSLLEPAKHGRERRPTDVGRAGLYISSLIDARNSRARVVCEKDRRIEDGDVEMSPGTLGASPQQFDPSLADHQSPPVGRDRCGMAILISDSPIFERIGEAGSITSSTRTTGRSNRSMCPATLPSCGALTRR
jgi:hypothetical protein